MFDGIQLGDWIVPAIAVLIVLVVPVLRKVLTGTFTRGAVATGVVTTGSYQALKPSTAFGELSIDDKTYKTIFFSVLALTAVCLALNVILVVMNPNPDPDSMGQPMKDLLETLATGWKTGFGAIVGLIGGKAAS